MNQSQSIALTKQSNQHEIRAYFEGVMRIANSNEQFPVNLDEVWPLVYESKQKAVNELKNTQNEDGTPRYIQGVDYQSLNQKVAAGHTMSTVHNYYLSVSCIEWFIARKVRPVFEVYRQVFHKAVSPAFQIPQSFAEALRLAAEQTERIEAQNRLLEAKDEKIESMLPKEVFADSFKVSDTLILMRDMAKLLNQNGIDIGEIRLYEWMVENKYLIRSQRWSRSKQRYEWDYMPTQRAADLKVFFVIERPIPTTPAEPPMIKHTVKITGKGQIHFMNKFLKKAA